MRTIIGVMAALALLTGGAVSAWAGGNQAYPNGVEDMMSGMLPPPGFYLFSYSYFYDAERFPDLPPGVTADVEVFGQVPRLLYVSDKTFLGASIATHVFFLGLDIDANLDGMPPGTEDFFDVDTFGMGDIIYDPFILGWHGEHVHVVAGLDMYIPAGKYNKDKFANQGNNNWTFEPVVAVTLLGPCGWAASSKFMYDISTTNNDYVPFPGMDEGKIRPGQEFHADFSLDKELCPGVRAGMAGYCYWQLTSDKTNDIPNTEDPHSRVWALGPGLMYTKGLWTITAKAAWEFAAVNHSEGMTGVFKVIRAFPAMAPGK